MEEWKMLDRLDSFCKENPHAGSELGHFLSKQIWSPSDREAILNHLALLLLRSDHTLSIAKHLGPVLLDLLSRCQLMLKGNGPECLSRHEQLCIAVSQLIGFRDDMKPFALQYFKTHPSLFARYEQCAGQPPPKKRKSRERISLRRLAEAAYKFLVCDVNAFRDMWNWSPILTLFNNCEKETKWVACKCVALLTGMNEVQLLSLWRQQFTDEEIRELLLDLSGHYSISQLEFLPASLPSADVVLAPESIRTHTMKSFLSTDFSHNVTSICGVLLQKLETDKELKHQFVMVPSLEKNMRKMALSVANNQPVLLQGPVGCGKTTLVEHLAHATGHVGSNRFIKVQMGEQTDSKLLLGAHCCTDIPGEFVWRPGPLVQAMTKGAWLLLEDIDCASREVVSMLVPVLENKSVTLPGHEKPFEADPGFQLFATRRLVVGHSSNYSEFHHHAKAWKRLWRTVNVEPLLRTELCKVILTLWPVLEPVMERILDIYYMMCSVGHDEDEFVPSMFASSSLGGRQVSTRDLMKWCSRITANFDLQSVKMAEGVFQDALDCFCQSIPSLELRARVAEAIGAKLNIPKTKAEFYTCNYKPDLTLMSGSFTVGRVTLEHREMSLLGRDRSEFPVFAHTRQAVALLERVTVSVNNEESVLLVGETGTGKTCIVQYLAHMTGHKLTVVNMNQQSDSADLLGGYKPLELKLLLAPLREEYEEIFCLTHSREANAKFLGHIMNAFTGRRWNILLTLMERTQERAVHILEKDEVRGTRSDLLSRWKKLGQKIHEIKTRCKLAEHCLAFSFVEGSLVKCMKEGNWILLDEINLAEAETLECLGTVLESREGSVLLLERGDKEPILRHPSFRLFACMNPATDVGKKELPLGIRNRFSEFFMEELKDKQDLKVLISTYLQGLSLTSQQLHNITNLYLQLREMTRTALNDANGGHPHYSLRTLCRALSFAAKNPYGNILRSVYEGFCLSFLTQLDRESHHLVEDTIGRYLVGEKKLPTLLKTTTFMMPDEKYLNFEGYWIAVGPKTPEVPANYILTPSVRLNLRDLSRVVSAGRHPVLLQGETSVGKTSMIQWLASSSGNVCTRINNHEHTDLQEYIGTYLADHSGKLVFKEGILVEAMRKGYWIILDELNLAPSEVLEALNRVLDDNRELFIPETQQTVKAHERFMLFATQNPPGHYGGRKVLSRAFRNRFVELHFDEIPPSELETILHERCALPLSYAKKMVAVMTDLQLHRKETGVFAGKQGYMTLRDLFRWGERYRQAGEQQERFYDWNQHLSEEG